MSLTESLSLFYGVFFSVIGFGMVFNQKFYRLLAETVDKEKGAILAKGIMGLLVGFWLVLNHTLFADIIQISVTLINWIVFLTGVLVLAFTKYALIIVDTWKKHSYIVLYEGIVLLILGGVFISYLLFI